MVVRLPFSVFEAMDNKYLMREQSRPWMFVVFGLSLAHKAHELEQTSGTTLSKLMRVRFDLLFLQPMRDQRRLDIHRRTICNTRIGCVLLLLIMLIAVPSLGQHEFFHEVRLEKVLIEREHWELEGEADWKHLYNEPGWRRWGGSVSGVRHLDAFRISGGMNGYYTFNSSITNFFEFRPWTALNHALTLGPRISLRQRLKGEWRFFYGGGEAQWENYRRLRYQIGFDIPLSADHSGHGVAWRVRPHFEWFIIRDPATLERYPNSRDYGLTFLKQFENHHELSLGCKVEEFYRTEGEHGTGYIAVVGFAF